MRVSSHNQGRLGTDCRGHTKPSGGGQCLNFGPADVHVAGEHSPVACKGRLGWVTRGPFGCVSCVVKDGESLLSRHAQHLGDIQQVSPLCVSHQAIPPSRHAYLPEIFTVGTMCGLM